MPKMRLAVGERPARELHFDQVARRVHHAAERRLRLVVGGRIHVDAAGEQHAVEPVVDLAKRGNVLEQRDHPRDRAYGCGRGQVVALVHDP